MTTLLVHLDDDRLCSIEVDPASLETQALDPDFSVATAFEGTRSDLPGAKITQDSRVAGLLDRLPEAGGEPIMLSLSCGPTSSYALFRREGDGRQEVRIKIGEEAHLATDTRIMDLLTETQRHFLARVPRAR